jgi:hypothetical protein
MTHGASGTPERNSYHSMVDRCSGKHTRYARRYYGRGITICERWLGDDGFKNFLADMGPRPPGTSLDRIDNDGNYEPENCRWATASQQQQNTSYNRMLTAFGETLCVAEWARRYGLNPDRVHARLQRGWAVERAISTPSKAKGGSYERTGEVRGSKT